MVNVNPENVKLLQIKVKNESDLKSLMDDDEYDKFLGTLDENKVEVNQTLIEAVFGKTLKGSTDKHADPTDVNNASKTEVASDANTDKAKTVDKHIDEREADHKTKENKPLDSEKK